MSMSCVARGTPWSATACAPKRYHLAPTHFIARPTASNATSTLPRCEGGEPRALLLVRLEVFLVVLRIGPPWIREVSSGSKLFHPPEQLQRCVTPHEPPERFALQPFGKGPIPGEQRSDFRTCKGESAHRVPAYTSARLETSPTEAASGWVVRIGTCWR
jgi:hypothetical protein